MKTDIDGLDLYSNYLDYRRLLTFTTNLDIFLEDLVYFLGTHEVSKLKIDLNYTDIFITPLAIIKLI
jgi:hypothetical protein